MKNKSESLKTNNLIKALYVLFITTTMISTISLSKFYSKVEGGQDNPVNVAAFAITAEGQENSDYFLKYDENVDVYEINVSNSIDNRVSEVSIGYNVIITVPKVLVGLEMDIDGITADLSSDGLTYTFKNIGEFEAGIAETNTHILTLIANYDNAIANIYSGIKISVYAEQIN